MRNRWNVPSSVQFLPRALLVQQIATQPQRTAEGAQRFFAREADTRGVTSLPARSPVSAGISALVASLEDQHRRARVASYVEAQAPTAQIRTVGRGMTGPMLPEAFDPLPESAGRGKNIAAGTDMAGTVRQLDMIQEVVERQQRQAEARASRLQDALGQVAALQHAIKLTIRG
jgi:hypothetical protein